MIKRKILVVENQYTQFKTISKKLQEHDVSSSSQEYDVFPSLEEYKEMMDWVRIFLNTRYKDPKITAKVDTAYSQLKDYIISNGIELFMIDFKLVGPHDGKTGVYLAAQLYGVPEFMNIPVIFLSKLPEKAKEVEREFDEFKERLKNYKWVEKGYAGVSLFGKSYFERYVKAEIPGLFKKSETDLLTEKVDELLKSERLRNFFPKAISYLKEQKKEAENNREYSEKPGKIITELYKLRDGSKSVLEDFINKNISK